MQENHTPQTPQSQVGPIPPLPDPPVIPYLELPYGQHVRRLINEQGYVYFVLRPSPGKRVKVMEHRWVWEQANGPIPPGMVLHHINGCKWDTRLEKLELIARQEHIRFHCCARPAMQRTSEAFRAHFERA